MEAIVKRSARAILVDDRRRLLLIKRTKPSQPPYWTAPGGGVDSGDASPAAALQRELTEELGASANNVEQVFLFSSPTGNDGVSVQHFFVCRLGEFDWSSRTGDEYSNPHRGGYDLDYIDLTDDSLSNVDLKPAALKDFILANRDALLDEVGLLVR